MQYENSRIEDPIELFTGDEPRDLSSFFSAITESRKYFRGTTIPALTIEWTQAESGLLFPASNFPNPIDQVAVYITAEDVFGVKMPLRLAIDEVRGISFSGIIKLTANIMARLRDPGATQKDVDIAVARLWFKGPARSRALNLINYADRVLVVPQILFTLIKYAAWFSGDEVLPRAKKGSFARAAIVFSDHVNTYESEKTGQKVIQDSPGPLGREIISNQVFNSALDELALLVRFERVWLQMPTEYAESPNVVDLEEEYRKAVGCSLRDVVTIGLVLWTAALKNTPSRIHGFLEGQGWTSAYIDSVLDVFSLNIPTFRAEMRNESSQVGDWAFDSFGRYPVVRLDNNELVVTDPYLLLKRIFGWPVALELCFRIKEYGSPKFADTVMGCVRFLTEQYVNEVFQSIAPDSPHARRTYFEKDLKAVYGLKVSVPDVAINYGDSWVIAEITTTQLRRESVAGVSDEAIMQDIEKLMKKVGQIQSLINILRSRSRELTDVTPVGPVQFFPVLVLTEGFPVNPISMTLVRDRARSQGLLQQSDIAPLEIIDVAELEIVEGLEEQGGPNLLKILKDKRTSNFQRMSMRDYLFTERGFSVGYSSRVTELWDSFFQCATSSFTPKKNGTHAQD